MKTTAPSYQKAPVVAALCGVNVVTIRRWVEERHMPCFKTPGGHMRFDLVEVIRWYAEQNLRAPQALRDASFEQAPAA